MGIKTLSFYSVQLVRTGLKNLYCAIEILFILFAFSPLCVFCRNVFGISDDILVYLIKESIENSFVLIHDD